MAKLLRYIVHDLPTEPQGRPFWQIQVEYSNHTVQDISSYNDYLPERPEELYVSPREYFEPEEESGRKYV